MPQMISPLFTLIPLYLIGNLHCAGMCGPLVFMLGSHRYRYFYFFGRLLSFSLAGLLAGAFGEVLQLICNPYDLFAWITLFFGGILLCAGLFSFLPGRTTSRWKPPAILLRIQNRVAHLMLADRRWPLFLFGFFTVFLPCGQTVIVYATLAIEAEALNGLLSGALFAILTSPSLVLAMHAQSALHRLKDYYRPLLGGAACLIGLMTICRALAQMAWIPHLVISPTYHIVLY